MDTKLYYHFLKDAREMKLKLAHQKSGWATEDYRPPLGEDPLDGQNGLPLTGPDNLMAEVEGEQQGL